MASEKYQVKVNDQDYKVEVVPNSGEIRMNGMPLEDYGATNNVMEMGPPTFENAKFQHGASESKLEIKF